MILHYFVILASESYVHSANHCYQKWHVLMFRGISHWNCPTKGIILACKNSEDAPLFKMSRYRRTLVNMPNTGKSRKKVYF